ncbi:hypothetical protein ACSBR1_021409 [Camellia fascicularis]
MGRGRVGEEGTRGYIGPRLILFGGATALEGNSAAPGTPSSAGSAGIRLHPLENLPLQGQHMWQLLWVLWLVIQGGIGLAGLSAEDLHVLDLTQQRPRWHRVVVQGPGPGPRYGHVIALVGQRYLMAIGGNDGESLDICFILCARVCFPFSGVKQ